MKRKPINKPIKKAVRHWDLGKRLEHRLNRNKKK